MEDLTLRACGRFRGRPKRGGIRESELDGNPYGHGLRTAVDASASVVLSR